MIWPCVKCSVCNDLIPDSQKRVEFYPSENKIKFYVTCHGEIDCMDWSKDQMILDQIKGTIGNSFVRQEHLT